MALVPATITVNFTSNYNGPHRVCYRVVGDPSYICTVPGSPPGAPGIHPNCGIGACSYDINITVDNETCAQIDYEGYVQPACEDEASLNGRVPFTVSFTPSPACKRYKVTCDNSPMGSGTIDTPGNSGYTDGTYPGLAVIGGGGTGATVDITVAGGVITTAVISTAGSGYTGTGLVDLTSIPFTPGTPTTVTVTPLGCSALTIYDCSGATVEILPLSTFQPSELIHMCNTGGAPTVPSDYSVVEDGNCLCNCIEVTIDNTGTAGAGNEIDYTYIDCNGNVVTGLLDAASPAVGPVCIVNSSLSYTINGAGAANITYGATCNAVP